MWSRRYIRNLTGYAVTATLIISVATRIECTTVVMYRSSSQIVVGADTFLHENTPAGSSRSGHICKIRKKKHIYLTMAGFASQTHTGYNAFNLALNAITHSTDIVSAAQQFIQIGSKPFQQALTFERSVRPKEYEKWIKNRDPEALQVLFMGMERGTPTVAVVAFTISEDAHRRILVISSLHTCPGDRCPPVGPGLEGLLFVGIGEHKAVDRISKEPSFPTELRRDPVFTIRRVIEAQIRDTPTYVTAPN